MTVTRLRSNAHERIAALERRADVHDQVIPPMAEQVHEMYELLKKWRNINWFVIKFVAVAGGGLGIVAVVSTLWVNAARLITGH